MDEPEPPRDDETETFQGWMDSMSYYVVKLHPDIQAQVDRIDAGIRRLLELLDAGGPPGREEP